MAEGIDRHKNLRSALAFRAVIPGARAAFRRRAKRAAIDDRGSRLWAASRRETQDRPQILPWLVAGKKRVALEVDGTFEDYALGNFAQVTPKLDLDITTWLPQVQLGYAFGNFDNTASGSATRYYQPQTIRGVTLTAVAHPLNPLYFVISYLPANRNYIAVGKVTQNTFGGKAHWNLAPGFRLSFYGEDTWYQGGSDRALGGGKLRVLAAASLLKGMRADLLSRR